VNLSIGICPQIEDMLEVCIDEGVQVETAIYKPDFLAPRIEESGVTWIHKTARVMDAVHAEKLGADAVIVVGVEGVGFKNPQQLPTMVTTAWAKRELKVPFIAAGGIGEARGFLGALGMGADCVMMGTAFMATDECPMKKSAKEAMVKARPDDPELRRRTLAPPDPKAYQEVMDMRENLPLEKWLPKLERVYAKGTSLWEDTADRAEPSSSELSKVVSLAAGFIDKVVPVQDFIDHMIHESEELLESCPFINQG
jgi:nitronate monooxygenase